MVTTSISGTRSRDGAVLIRAMRCAAMAGYRLTTEKTDEDSSLLLLVAPDKNQPINDGWDGMEQKRGGVLYGKYNSLVMIFPAEPMVVQEVGESVSNCIGYS